MCRRPSIAVSNARPPREFRFCDVIAARTPNSRDMPIDRGFLPSGQTLPIVHGPVRLGHCQHGEAVIVHAVAVVTGIDPSWPVMRSHFHRQRRRTLVLYRPKFGSSPEASSTISPRPGDAGAAVPSAPLALFGLRLDEVIQALVVKLAHVARDRFADAGVRRLGEPGRPSRRAESTAAASHRGMACLQNCYKTRGGGGIESSSSIMTPFCFRFATDIPCIGRPTAF